MVGQTMLRAYHPTGNLPGDVAMAERLGVVLYWAGCILAAVLAAGAIWVLSVDWDNRDPFFAAFVFSPAVIAWLLGKACRYVLAGY